MTTGLPVSRLIRVDVNLSPNAAQAPNLNSLLIVGDSDVIDTQTRIVSFGSLTEVSALFGSSAPETLAAALFFGQVPSPTQLFIGRWAQSAVAGRLFGGALSASQQLLSNFTAIVAGGLKVSVDGGALTNVTGINLSGALNLNGVATLINTALAGAALGVTVAWDGTRFVFKSATTGGASSVSFLQAPTAGTSLVPLLNGSAALGARAVVGIAAETALACAAVMESQPVGWYGLAFASANIVDADHLAIAAYIEGLKPKHLYGITSSAPGLIDPTSTTDIGYLLKAAGYQQSFAQFSTWNPYAVVSMFGRLLTTNFDANASMITMMFKQEPGVVAEQLLSQQADALKAKNVNAFASYENNTAIVQYGTVANGFFLDEVYGVAWLKYRIQNDLFNALYANPKKIPQTDRGMGQLATVIEGSCSAGVNNGLIAEGYWSQGGFGQLQPGDYMPSGFYVYTPPISSQSTADRAARKSVAFQVGAKLAGAVHLVDVLININR